MYYADSYRFLYMGTSDKRGDSKYIQMIALAEIKGGVAWGGK